jgi:hypothetical protein
MAAPVQQSLGRRLLLWASMILILLAIVEGISVTFIRVVMPKRAHFLLWEPDIAAARKLWTEVAGNWDDELGWPSPRAAVSLPRDKTGAKFNPDFPQPGHACASAYGDSFIWGDDIPLQDGWIEQMSRKLGCRVANYGVSGYGTDQAYVRFKRNTADEAPVVLFGIFPGDIVRNVNQFRALIGFRPNPRTLKGRFILDSAGHLKWVHRPRLDEAGFIHLVRDPAGVLPHEYLLPDTRDGPVSVRFPYTLTLARLALMPRLRTRITGLPTWSSFFHADHPSGAFPLTAAITVAFAREAERRGKRALVVMLPDASSFRARAKLGKPVYAPLLAALAAKHVAVFDPIPALLSALGSRSYCMLFAQPANCNGHFGVAGGGILADVMMAELRRRGWLK